MNGVRYQPCFNKETHPWSQRLTFRLVGYGLLMVTDRNWYVPHNEEAALHARHLTVNFRLHHALKPWQSIPGIV